MIKKIDSVKKFNEKILIKHNLNISKIIKNLSLSGYNYNDPYLSFHYKFCASNFKFRNILELGTGPSEFTYFLSYNFPKSKIITIDDYIHTKERSFKGSSLFKNKKFLKKKNITFLKANSKIIKTFKKKFDFIFVDADHLFPGVSIDILNSMNILKKDGIILVDDIVKENFKNEYISNSAYILLEYLKRSKIVQVEYLRKRLVSEKKTKFIAILKLI